MLENQRDRCKLTEVLMRIIILLQYFTQLCLLMTTKASVTLKDERSIS